VVKAMRPPSQSCLIVLGLLSLNILSLQSQRRLAVSAQSQPVIATDYSFYKGDLDPSSGPVARVNGYLRNETSANCYMRIQYLADMPEVVGVGQFYGPDGRLVQFRMGKSDPRKAGDTSVWTVGTDMISRVQNNTGIWRLEMYHGPYLLFTERFTVGDYLATVSVTGFPSKFAAKVWVDEAEAGTIRGGEKKPSALATGTHKIFVDSIVEATAGTRFVCYKNSWNVSSGGAHTFEYVTQHHLSVKSPYGETSGSGWHIEGSKAVFSAQSLVADGPGVRYLFTKWTGNYAGVSPEGTILMDGPKNVTANYRTQYYLKVESRYGHPKGEGWYDEGATANLSVASIIVLADLTEAVFVRWGGDLTSPSRIATITMNKPYTVIANWRVQAGKAEVQYLYIVVGAFFIIAVLGAYLFLWMRKPERPFPKGD